MPSPVVQDWSNWKGPRACQLETRVSTPSLDMHSDSSPNKSHHGHSRPHQGKLRRWRGALKKKKSQTIITSTATVCFPWDHFQVPKRESFRYVLIQKGRSFFRFHVRLRRDATDLWCGKYDCDIAPDTKVLCLPLKVVRRNFMCPKKPGMFGVSLSLL